MSCLSSPATATITLLGKRTGGFPHLSTDKIVVFFYINIVGFCRRKDRIIGQGWDNDRGVVHAPEEYFDCTFDENELFETVQSRFVVEHYPLCSGLIVLRKVGSVIP